MKKSNFSDVLDAAGGLPVDEREELVELLHHRMIEERRSELAKEVKNARREHRQQKGSPSSAKDIMREILS